MKYQLLKNSFFLFFFIFLMGNCTQDENSTNASLNPLAIKTGSTNNDFKDYWYKGKAEITSYDLQQVRYGEVRKGNSVFIFVTEDFSKKKQVKLDDPSKNRADAVPILKLNATRKFNTGIYPYSTMQSIFTPVDLKKMPSSLKVATSSQEWCGHTFMQMNLKGNNYQVQSNSYFESEGDENFKVEKALLEEELFSLLRMNPKYLPQGGFKIIPSTLFARLKHVDFHVEKASGLLEEKNEHQIYTVDYSTIERKLRIVFEKTFPYQILSWEETHKSGFGSNAKTMTTKATKKKSIMLDYWSKNNVADLHYRQELGLE